MTWMANIFSGTSDAILRLVICVFCREKRIELGISIVCFHSKMLLDLESTIVRYVDRECKSKSVSTIKLLSTIKEYIQIQEPKDHKTKPSLTI